MNADIDQEHLQLDYVLKQLYKAVKGLNVNKLQEVTVTYRVAEPEDLNDTLYTSSVLKEQKVIEDYKEYDSGTEKDTLKYAGHPDYEADVYFYKFKYKLKPKALMSYLIDTSRLPIYTLEFDDVRSKVILNKEYVLATPDYDGPNYSFFSYAINKSRKIIRKENFSEGLVGKRNLDKINKKPLRSIIEQILKNNELIKVFFPHISKDSAYFRNEVTVKDLVGQKIDRKKIRAFLETDKRVFRLKPLKD